MDEKEIFIALTGNPNAGKTTLFNQITGARQHVGNYPGVTVEKKEGVYSKDGKDIIVVDLPGTYSLSATSLEEKVTRDFIVNEKPDVVVDVVDASNLERNLYLAVQLFELGAPVVLAFNMVDVAQERGYRIDIKKLSQLLRVPIIPTVGVKGEGIDELMDNALKVALSGKKQNVKISYGKELEASIEKIGDLLKSRGMLLEGYDTRWIAMKLLEVDEDIMEKARASFSGWFKTLMEEVQSERKRLEKLLGDDPAILFADRRYGFISGACTEALRTTSEERHTLSDKLDAVFINRVLGIPIFLILMYLVFQLTFTVGAPPMDWIDAGFGWLGDAISGLWAPGAESALKSLLVDGVIAGVGGVIIFLPNVMLLFLAIAILEDSGYMARAAFIMDRMMHKIGLHGKSFIPLLLGFGCTIPAVMATRTIENERDRLTTILVSPLMSCGARLPIYALIIPAFFAPKWRGPMLWTIYVIGIVIAVVLAKLLRSAIFKGEAAPFVMELPPYHMPTLKGVLIHMWERGYIFLRKAGTIILGVAIVLWAITSYPKPHTFPEQIRAQEASIERAYNQEVSKIASSLQVPSVQSFTKALRNGGISTASLGEKASLFIGMVKEIQGIETKFSEETDGLEEESSAYKQAKDKEEKSLGTLRQRDPSVFGMAQRYVDEIDAKYQEKVASLRNKQAAYTFDYSIAGRIGSLLEPLMKPLGFNRKLATPMIGAIAAKEVFVAQLGIVYAVGEADEESTPLREKLQKDYSPLQAFCIMLFLLISMPCIATFAIVRRETNSWKWPFVQAFGLTGLAYILTLIVYQVGSLLA